MFRKKEKSHLPIDYKEVLKAFSEKEENEFGLVSQMQKAAMTNEDRNFEITATDSNLIARLLLIDTTKEQLKMTYVPENEILFPDYGTELIKSSLTRFLNREGKIDIFTSEIDVDKIKKERFYQENFRNIDIFTSDSKLFPILISDKKGEYCHIDINGRVNFGKDSKKDSFFYDLIVGTEEKKVA